MKVDLVVLPSELRPEHLAGKAAVVFDVLRATTSMTAALTAGVREIRVFDTLDAARGAAKEFAGPRILCGEERCLAPAGFDLGNSPGAFSGDHAGRTIFMCTTNGTRAILAARGAAMLLIGALVNASAVARHLAQSGLDVTLVCAGTNGSIALEDLIGAGAVMSALIDASKCDPVSDAARIALRLFRGAKDDLAGALSDSAGGRNVLGVGLAADIAYAASLNRLNGVGIVKDDPLRVTISL